MVGTIRPLLTTVLCVRSEDASQLKTFYMPKANNDSTFEKVFWACSLGVIRNQILFLKVFLYSKGDRPVSFLKYVEKWVWLLNPIREAISDIDSFVLRRRRFPSFILKFKIYLCILIPVCLMKSLLRWYS